MFAGILKYIVTAILDYLVKHFMNVFKHKQVQDEKTKKDQELAKNVETANDEKDEVKKATEAANG